MKHRRCIDGRVNKFLGFAAHVAEPMARPTVQESFMNRKWIAPIAAALIGTGFLVATVFAYGEGGGGRGHHHGGSSAMGLCISVMTPAQKASLLTSLGSSWETLKADSETVRSDKAAITHDILYGNSVTTDETNLAAAESALQSAKDSLASQVCGKVSKLAAVQNLYNELQGLQVQEKTLHQQAHTDFKTAQSAQ
jgi:hypothetical protein